MLTGKKLYLGIRTEIGPNKVMNDDYFDIETCSLSSGETAHLLLIADGMGGHAFGDIASFYAVNLFLKWWKKTSLQSQSAKTFLRRCKEEIPQVFEAINKKLIATGKKDDKGIGTTLTVLLLTDDQYFICHVGDCRIYQLRNSKRIADRYSDDTVDLTREKAFLQLTRDHSWANMQIDNGTMKAEEAYRHPKATILTQCLGIRGQIEPYTTTGTFKDTDHFLLCTDGFYSLFDDTVIYKQWIKQLQAGQNEEEIAAYFLKLAKRANHHDDVSILFANLC